MRAEFGQNTLLKKPIKYDRTSYSEEAAAATQINYQSTQIQTKNLIPF